MARFLLIHGSCHGAWCWRDVVPALEAAGHEATAIDLPGNAGSPIAPGDATLENSGQAILDASTPDTVVVGHSWAGYPIGQAAEMDPKGLKALIFLCAYVPNDGLSMVDMRKRAPHHPILPAVIRDPDGITISIDPEQAPGIFYSDCGPEIVDYAVPRLCPQAIRPQATPITVTDRYASVPKHYIRCTEDRTIPPEYQAEMVKDWPEGTVHEMQRSHSPFFSDPAGLAGLLGRIAKAL